MSRRAVVKWERKGGMVCVLWKERPEEVKAAKNWMIRVVCLPHESMVTSVLMSVTHVTTEGLQLKYKGQSEPVLPFTGPGKAGPTP